MALLSSILVIPTTTTLGKEYQPRVINDYSEIDFYLHTVEVGNLVFDNFGHTAIRVLDHRTGDDFVLNWGLFNFDHPVTFSYNFFKGILIYRLGSYPTAFAHRIYKWQRRTVWEDRINLSNDQKERLYQSITHNLKPDNTHYPYQYFFDNCSTRPRDLIDDAIGGGLNGATAQQSSGATFRHMVRSHYASLPPIAWALDLLMNSRIDRPMTTWQHMFLPKTLRQVLLETTNSPGTQTAVLGDSRILYKYDSPTVGSNLSAVLIITVATGLLLWLLWRSSFQQNSSAFFRAQGIITITFGLFSGIFGNLMLLAWLFSAHQDLHHNANLWVLWPTDIFFVIIGGYLLWRAQPYELNRRWRMIAHGYCAAHAAAALAHIILSASGFFAQNVSQVATYISPLILLFNWVCLRSAFRPQEHDQPHQAIAPNPVTSTSGS